MIAGFAGTGFADMGHDHNVREAAWRLNACQSDAERSAWALTFGAALTDQRDSEAAEDKIAELEAEATGFEESKDRLLLAIEEALNGLEKIEGTEVDAIYTALNLAMERE